MAWRTAAITPACIVSRIDVCVPGCNDLARGSGSIMSDTQRGLPPGLDRIAHERRARLIAQLHRQATATANDQHKAIGAGTTRRLETVAWVSIAGTFIVALGSILTLLAVMQ